MSATSTSRVLFTLLIFIALNVLTTTTNAQQKLICMNKRFIDAKYVIIAMKFTNRCQTSKVGKNPNTYVIKIPGRIETVTYNSPIPSNYAIIADKDLSTVGGRTIARLSGTAFICKGYNIPCNYYHAPARPVQVIPEKEIAMELSRQQTCKDGSVKINKRNPSAKVSILPPIKAN